MPVAQAECRDSMPKTRTGALVMKSLEYRFLALDDYPALFRAGFKSPSYRYPPSASVSS